MTYFELLPPKKWRAGTVGAGPTAREFFFDCADCDAKEPEIAGILGTTGRYEDIAILPIPGSPMVKLAMFCAPCFAKRIAEGKRRAFLLGNFSLTPPTATPPPPAQYGTKNH